MTNSTKQQMMKAKKLIQAKRYDDARAILITIDHPLAEKWLSKLPIPTQGTDKKEPPSTAKIIVFLILFAFCGLPIMWIVFNSGGAEYNVEVACTIAEEAGYNCNPEVVMTRWPDAVDTCEETVNKDSPLFYEVYAVCLQVEGVNMGQ